MLGSICHTRVVIIRLELGKEAGMDNKLGLKKGQRITFKTAYVDGTGTIREAMPSMVIIITDVSQETRTGRKLGRHNLTVYNSQVIDQEAR